MSKEFVMTPELLTLLERLHIEHEGTLPSIVEATQKAWLRPAHQERWEIENHWTEKERKAVLEYYQATGKLQEIPPFQSHYQGALIGGTTVVWMKERLQFFERSWEKGCRVNEVNFLTSARLLDEKIEILPANCHTEGDAMMALWEESPLFKAVVWKHLEHPMIQTEDSSKHRPTTLDTLHFWLKTSPQKGLYLLVTDQPYCCYFDAVARLALPSSIQAEVVGPSAEADSQETGLLLDNLARWLYVENQVRTRSHEE